VTTVFPIYPNTMNLYCFRTHMAHCSHDGFRCGSCICRLRSVLQPSTHRRCARGPTPASRGKITLSPLLPSFRTLGRIIITRSTPTR
jgi:hypothetical protein